MGRPLRQPSRRSMEQTGGPFGQECPTLRVDDVFDFVEPAPFAFDVRHFARSLHCTKGGVDVRHERTVVATKE